jgi:hypothetical protein
MGWSFGIFTDGVSCEYHQEIVSSIKKTVSENYEIVFVTENRAFRSSEKVLYVDVPCMNPISSLHCTKKNFFSFHALYDNICMMHDYIKLDENFVQSFEQFGDDWDVCSIPLVLPDGNRWWDWRIEGHPIYGSSLVSYDCPPSVYHFVTGNLFMVKRNFIMKYPMIDPYGGSEDLGWSRSVNTHWRYRLNKNTKAFSLRQKDIDPRQYLNSNLII